MAATTTLLQHPLHEEQHPLEVRDFRKDSTPPRCHICSWNISADGYACMECKFYAHRVCAEAPPRIDLHPLHTDHPLTLIHCPQPFRCDSCGESFTCSSLSCNECNFDLDICCALSTQSDRGDSQGKTPEQIYLPHHPHTLTSFSTRHDIIGYSNCVICKESVEGDWYACLKLRCQFFIHKRCIQDLYYILIKKKDLYYTDGTKAPQVYHCHPLETFLEEDTGSSRCANCGSKASSGEFIGCAECQVFYCRDCVQVPDIIQYPHNPDHIFFLFSDHPDHIFFLFSDHPDHKLNPIFLFSSSSSLSMATTTLLQHPRHKQHPLQSKDFSKNTITPRCDLCSWKIWADGYACEDCFFHVHRECAEAPPRIDLHPLHTDHPLTLIHRPPPFQCDVCGGTFDSGTSFYIREDYGFKMDLTCAMSTLSGLGRTQGKTPVQFNFPLHCHKLTSCSTMHGYFGKSICQICKISVEGYGYACLHYQCDFLIHKRCIQDLLGDEYDDVNLDISCASSFLLDRGGSKGKTPKWIALQFHHHLLTFFSTKYDFVGDSDCVICNTSVKVDGYTCLHWNCKFLIHERCIQAPYYTDGTKAPQVYHRHPLETFLGEDMDSNRCANCEYRALSREFIGCTRCDVFIHRDCAQVPEIIQYPHHQKHALVLLINTSNNDKPQCDSCSVYLSGKLCYGCPCCMFFVDMECALQVLSYCGEGMSAKIELSWHEHPLFICHGDGTYCSYCVDIFAGPMYACIEEGCNILLHKRCTEIKSTIIHPHHWDHPLTLCSKANFERCGVCGFTNYNFYFSCELCQFFIDLGCAARFPSQKYSLHEHELLHLDNGLNLECNRCGTSTNARIFRCAPCNFSLHEECTVLPRVVKSEIHWHPLTLHETYIEDDSGEYYCDKCEKRRDERMGAYVCLQCLARWVYHIECVLPELRKVCVKDNTITIERLTEEILIAEEEVRAVERKLDRMKRELEEKRKKRASLIIME